MLEVIKSRQENKHLHTVPLIYRCALSIVDDVNLGPDICIRVIFKQDSLSITLQKEDIRLADFP